MASRSVYSFSDSEEVFFYFGLPSEPRLVYDTGPPWIKPYGIEEYSRKMALRPVFAHKAVDAWGELGPKVVACLDSKNLKFTTIDWVRFATEADPPGPVTLSDGVLPDSLTAEDARTAARACLALLKEFDITDVEVAFRTSIYTRSAGPRLLEPVEFWHSTAGVRGPLLGLRIAARNTPHVEGAGGFYFAEGDKLFLVTTRHVLFPPNTGFNDYYDRTNTSAPRHDVLLLGTRAFNDVVAAIEAKIGRHHLDFHNHKRQLQALEKKAAKNKKKTTRKEPTAEWKKLRELVGEEIQDGRALGKLHDEVTNDWAHESYTEDYAVVELDRSKIDKRAFRGNVIERCTTLMSSVEFWMAMTADIPTRGVCPIDRLYGLRDHLTEEDMRHPNMFASNGEERLLVIKSGFGSGLTLGCATGIFSYVREYFDDGTHRTSREWAIIPHGQKTDKFFGPNDPKPGAFSAPGDSGAVIVDGHRRFGGLLTGGAGANFAKTIDIDITYATSFFWLWSRIKADGFPDAHLDLDAFIAPDA
ncbi:hypothetical protein C8T65DRAFT_723862 [Cerioporus squamosus]|nr:hypothetical protein C8T65DRAFT_723862 [Cerioporus squamosus]